MKRVKIVLFLMTLIVSLADTCFAEQKYNPYVNQWETTYSDSQIKYNPYNNSWNYERQGSQMEYNPYTNRWEYQR